MKNGNQLILDVHDKPPINQWIALSLQHVFAMFGATVLVPILTNQLAGAEILTVPMALLTSGLGTLIYIFCTQNKSPVYHGSSFAFIAPMAAAAVKAGQSGVFSGTMAVGIVYIIAALITKIIGKSWIDKILPPVVVGPMIVTIGLGLAPTAINHIGLASNTTPDLKNIIVVLVTFLTTVLVSLRGNKFLKVIPFLVGIISGYTVSICLGMVDFTIIKNAPFFSIPTFVLPYVNYDFNFSIIWVIVPVALVTIAEHIGDHAVLSSIINRDLLKNPGLNRTLMGDGIATFISGLLGSSPKTTYAENTSVIGITKIASVNVFKLAAIIAISCSFLGKLTAVFSTVPNAVLGGVSLLLYGFITVNGLKVMIQNKIDFGNTRNLAIVAVMLILGIGGAILSIQIGEFSISLSGMSLAAICGVILNLCLPQEKRT